VLDLHVFCICFLLFPKVYLILLFHAENLTWQKSELKKFSTLVLMLYLAPRIDDILLKVIFNYSGRSFSYTYLKFYLYIVSDYSGTNYFSI
jgi:hypothetical protein